LLTIAKEGARNHGLLNVNVGDLFSVPVQVPPIAEQIRIAEILDTADEAAQWTERLIAKLEQTKRGLLHDLLAGGIDGSLPGWRLLPLSACVSAPITYGIVQAGPHIEDGVPYIRTGDMSGDHLDREGLLRTSQQIASSYARSTVRKGEIVCTIRATVGKVLPVPKELDGANLTQGTARISPAANIDAAYLLWALRGGSAQRQFGLAVKGTTFSEITLAQLREVRVPVPGAIAEQRHIAERMSAVDDKIAREALYLSKLRLLKQGLMEDLLTGRVRVGAWA
jgi:type I restriction enzyme S subunit